MSPVNLPFNLLRWIEDHAEDFAPPVANKVVWRDSDFIFMIVRGPNARNDFHIDPGDEIFMQLRGDIRVDTVDGEGRRHEHRVREGDVMLVPGGTPHAPLRPEDSWGLVIERPRGPDELDTVRWYCDCCGAVLHEVSFHVADIETELGPVLQDFDADESLRTCDACGCVLPRAEAFAWE